MCVIVMRAGSLDHGMKRRAMPDTMRRSRGFTSRASIHAGAARA